jgi:prepilin-type N-terminal cleavage/methylation domain-containing protein
MNSGFTLIEVIVIVVIMGVLAVVIIPNTTVQPVLRLEAACQKIQNDLRYIQEMAVAQQVRFGIYFNPSSEAYFGYRINTSTKAKDPHTRNDLNIDFTSLSEFKGVEIVSTNFNNALEFSGKGEPYNGLGVLLASEAVVTLQTTSGAYSKTIRIQPVTGKVKIE